MALRSRSASPDASPWLKAPPPPGDGQQPRVGGSPEGALTNPRESGRASGKRRDLRWGMEDARKMARERAGQRPGD